MPRANTKQWPRRPPRLVRLFDNVRPFYFITFNTHDRRSILARDEIHNTFCSFSAKAKEHDIAVGRYVIMPDHVHLFAAFPTHGVTLSMWVQSLRNVIGKKLLQFGIHKPHWQEGFFDHLLRSQESYSEKWEYVRMNPVRAKLCDTPDAWPSRVKSSGFLSTSRCSSRLAVLSRFPCIAYVCQHGDAAPWLQPRISVVLGQKNEVLHNLLPNFVQYVTE